MTDKIKIAVLGGGAASLFAVWELVHSDRNAYDITVYQMGWRLGGKGASGRNPEEHHRIEEHGLHLLFGFYENVFRVMRKAYAECYPADPHLLESFFRTADTAVAMINFRDAQRTVWDPWLVPYPEASPLRPGEPGPGESDRDERSNIELIIENMLRWVAGAFRTLLGVHVFVEHPIGDSVSLDDLRRGIDMADRIHTDSVGPEGRIIPWWEIARAFVARLAPHIPDLNELRGDIRRFESVIRRALEVVEYFGDRFAAETYAMIRFVLAVAKGVFVDLLVTGSWNWFSLDEYDFRAWIARHGGDPASPVVAGLYDAVFGTYSQIGAGAILQSSLKAAFLFRGGAIYKMHAGMGDTIFTPLYKVLKEMGVKFEFFHRVEHLGLSDDRQMVETITIERQVQLQAGPYQPLVTLPIQIGSLQNLDCWPSEPQWDQLTEADRLRVRGRLDLESYWTPAAPGRQVVLRRGTDFDEVILGISVAALPWLCEELLTEDPAFADHVLRLAPATTATQALQLWWMDSRKPRSPSPIVVPFVEPFDTIADMSHLLASERWPANTVGGLHYLCSAIEERSPVPPRAQDQYPVSLREAARANALDWMDNHAGVLWGRGFDWAALYDPAGRPGRERFDAQFVHTPTNLSDRYVLPVPMSYPFRLLSNETKFANLYLTGDWIRTSLSVGCLEAAAMSGIQAARALSIEKGTTRVSRACNDWIKDVEARTPRSGIARTAPLPRYRKRDGEVIAPPPYEVMCPNLLVLVLPADKQQLQLLCNRELNLGPIRYSPLGPYVMLYAATLDVCSTGMICCSKESGFWVPLVCEVDGRRALRTYSPYVWLDSATSTISGRGIYGYAKYTGSVEVPPADQLAGGVTVNGDALVAGTDTQPWAVAQQQLFTARPNAASGSVIPAGDYSGVARVFGDVLDLGPAELISLVTGMRSVFLKQLPAASGSVPAYQALVEAEIATHLDTVRGGALGPWTVTIPAHREPCIVDSLGLFGQQNFDGHMARTSTLRPLAQLWLSFQGRIEPGKEIWRELHEHA